jgi:hypothetical protein
MLVSVASLLPIAIVGPAADLMGGPAILALVSSLVCLGGVASVVRRTDLR